MLTKRSNGQTKPNHQIHLKNVIVTTDGFIVKVMEESRAKVAKMHIDGFWKYDAAHCSRLPGKTMRSNRWSMHELQCAVGRTKI